MNLDSLIMGIHPIKELLKHAPEKILQIYTSSRRVEERKESLLIECEKKKIPIRFVKEEELTRLCHSESHQSFAAQVAPRNFTDIKSFLKKIQDREKSVVLMCDQIFDPQNFGAILRSAECFGVDAVIWSKNRGSDLTPVVAKSSVGASEWLCLIRVSNLAESIPLFQEEGFEAFAAVLNSQAQNAMKFSFPPKTLLIVGSEGEGIQPLIQKRADACIYLPMWGKIESLNVAQATTALLTTYRQQQG